MCLSLTDDLQCRQWETDLQSLPSRDHSLVNHVNSSYKLFVKRQPQKNRTNVETSIDFLESYRVFHLSCCVFTIYTWSDCSLVFFLHFCCCIDASVSQCMTSYNYLFIFIHFFLFPKWFPFHSVNPRSSYFDGNCFCQVWVSLREIYRKINISHYNHMDEASKVQHVEWRRSGALPKYHTFLLLVFVNVNVLLAFWWWFHGICRLVWFIFGTGSWNKCVDRYLRAVACCLR